MPRPPSAFWYRSPSDGMPSPCIAAHSHGMNWHRRPWSAPTTLPTAPAATLTQLPRGSEAGDPTRQNLYTQLRLPPPPPGAVAVPGPVGVVTPAIPPV